MAAVSADILQRSCTTCHGPGETHVDDPDLSNIIAHPGADACRTCHPRARTSLQLYSGGHVRHDVACSSCHAAGHQPTTAAPLLRAAPRELCSECHPEQQAAFRLPYAHREGVEAFQCTACHAVHGTGRSGRLTLSGDGACVDCHSDKRGPFVFPHPPADRRGCVSCHQPHGSVNPRQLVRRETRHLCLECHANVPSFHDATQARYQRCQTCHAAVHGSNRSPALLEE